MPSEEMPRIVPHISAEKSDLELHVELCAKRYEEVQALLRKLHGEISFIKKFLIIGLSFLGGTVSVDSAILARVLQLLGDVFAR